MNPRRLALAVLALMGAVYLGLAGESVRALSVTVDEFGHVPVGHNVLSTGDFDYCELNPPLANVLSAVPLRAMRLEARGEVGPLGRNAGYSFWANGYRFMDLHRGDYVRAFTAARWATVLLGLLLGLTVFAWAGLLEPERRLPAGVLAAALVWFSPNLLAHASLATTDTAVGLGFAASLFAAHALLRKPGLARAVLCGVVLGAAQLTKFTAVYLYPVVLVLAWALAYRRLRMPGRRVLAGLAVVLVTSVLALNAGYLFQRTARPLGDFTFTSRPLLAVQGLLPRALPVPLPAAYVRAFDRQLADTAQGDPSYLLGRPYQGGRWDYFLTLLALKVPVPLWLLGLAALAARLAAPRSVREEDWLLLLPALTVFCAFSFLSNKQLGLRMILPAAPLFWLWVAVTLSRQRVTRARSVALAAMLGWLGVEVARARPDPLGYFNGVFPERGGLPLAGDSNLDWGQGLVALSRYAREHGQGSIQLLYFGRVDPAIYGIDYVVPERVQPGLLVVSTSLFTVPYVLYDHGQLGEQPRLDKVPSRFHHVGRLMHSLDVYRVDPLPAGAP